MIANAPKLITLSCPSCGAKLDISPNLDRFACAFCGQEHIVNRTGGTISLSPVVEAIHQVKTGVDKTAAELAIVRLQKEISNLLVERQNLPLRFPPPFVHIKFYASVFLGAFFILVSVVFLKAADDFSVLAVSFIIGVILLFIGVPPFTQLSEKKHVWEESIAVRSDEVDEQIKEKQIELIRNQDLVSN